MWSKSQYFRREETNFISANEIDNMALIMPTSTRRTVVSDTSMQTGGKVVPSTISLATHPKMLTQPFKKFSDNVCSNFLDQEKEEEPRQEA